LAKPKYGNYDEILAGSGFHIDGVRGSAASAPQMLVVYWTENGKGMATDNSISASTTSARVKLR
jgi:hypothetical protein